MDPADKDFLIRWRPELVEQIDIVNGLLTHLQSRKVLNQRMVQSITYNKPPDRQVEELLDLLPKRGPSAFRLFCDALTATDQDDVVTNYLRRKDTPELELEPASVSESETTSVPASPSSAVAGETCKIPISDHAATNKSFSSVSASPLPARISASFLSESTPSVLSNPATPNTKRKPECSRTATEIDDIAFLAGPSETDSSPLKRLRPGLANTQSVICIGDNDNVIKIYSSPLVEKKEEPSHNVFRSNGIVAQESSVAYVHHSHPIDSPSRPANTEEKRFVLKHFVTKDEAEEHTQEENIKLAAKLVSELPRQYLDLLSSKGGNPFKIGNTKQDIALDFVRERLSRCDSTDTMDPEITENLHIDASRRADSDQPDQSTVRLPSGTGRSIVLVPPAPLKMGDYTDGPIHVQVEKCTRQFYNDNKTKSYRMVGMPRGQALIINVNEVAGKPPRRGTDIDRDNLENLLIQLHFQVTVYSDSDDLTAQGMVDKLNEFVGRKEHGSGDASVICLLSHGEEGYMFGTDGKKIPLDEIFTLFDNRHCPMLLNKPKIFFIQACRGGMLDHGVKVPHDEHDGGQPVNNNNVVQHPSMSDMLICYPTLQGFYAWRNREKGSWYIEAVVKVFMKYAKEEDVCAMLNRVNSDVSRKVSRTPQLDMDRMSQMSEYKSSLRKPYLFFFPGIGTPSID